MQGKESMLGFMFTISDIAVPSLPQLHSLFLSGHIINLLLGGGLYVKCLQVCGD